MIAAVGTGASEGRAASISGDRVTPRRCGAAGGHLRRALFACALVVAPGIAQAQDLRIAIKAAVDSADPHNLFSPNRNVQIQVYEPLLGQDDHLRPRPGLAASWRVLDPLTWEFTLRDDLRFHDGSPLTSEDVVFSIRRAQTTEGARSYRPYLQAITAVEAVGPFGVRIRTATPSAAMLFNLATVGIVSARAAQDATAEDFNGGRAAIGTGPYRWVRLTPGQDVVLERNPAYRDGPEPWARVTYRFIGNDSARVAALLAGDVDVVDAVPSALSARVRDGAQTRLASTDSLFMFHMQLDQEREPSPFVTDHEGQPLARNPLRDGRVRQAFSLAINRAVLTERMMEGGASPANQFASEGFDGHVPDLPARRFDPAAARRLLADAGYPQGFGVTIHCMNDRFTGDARVCQATGQMLTAIGIKVRIEAMPATVYLRRANTGGPNGGPEFSVTLQGFGTSSGSGLLSLVNLVRSFDSRRGAGAANRGRYANPAIDALIARAADTLEDSEAPVRDAVRAAMENDALIPMFYIRANWGLRRALAMVLRGDQYTMATGIRPAGR